MLLGKSLAFAEISCGQVTSERVTLPWSPGKMFVCLGLKEASISLILSSQQKFPGEETLEYSSQNIFDLDSMGAPFLLT